MPGVPPNAIDNLKRAFKGIFKRGKKKEQAQTAETPSSSTADQSSSARPAAAAGANPPNTDKPLPPTHPLTTGEHKHPQEAVPQNHAAKPGPAKADVPGLKESVSDKADVSPASASAEARSDTVSALESENPPQAPPKSDILAPNSASAVSKPTETAATGTTVEHSTAAAPKLDPATSTPQAETSTAAAQEPVVQEQTNKPTPARPTTADEKIPAVEEPPPIKAVKAAPGMSATSGPLEDFPEGGDMEP